MSDVTIGRICSAPNASCTPDGGGAVAPAAMEIRTTEFHGVYVIESQVRRDSRGFFARTWCEREFDAAGLNTIWVQQNQTYTQGAGSVRGMHWQADPAPEIKLVRCLHGSILDVVVDIRRSSPTFGRWHAEELSGENMKALYIPAGFAHGFQCMGEACELLYLMSALYQPSLARGLRWNDPDVAIPWPLPVANLSPRDAGLPFLDELS